MLARRIADHLIEGNTACRTAQLASTPNISRNPTARPHGHCRARFGRRHLARCSNRRLPRHQINICQRRRGQFDARPLGAPALTRGAWRAIGDMLRGHVPAIIWCRSALRSLRMAILCRRAEGECLDLFASAPRGVDRLIARTRLLCIHHATFASEAAGKRGRVDARGQMTRKGLSQASERPKRLDPHDGGTVPADAVRRRNSRRPDRR